MADLRFERTDEMLQIQFIKLLTQIPFEQISVSKLAKSSKIDRTTFYAHYENTYQLAEKIINQHLAFIKNVIQKSMPQQLNATHFDSYAYFNDALVDYLMENQVEIQHLRQLNFGINSFDAKLRNLFNQTYSKILHFKTEDFGQYIITNLALSNFDFILEKQRVPSKKEIRDGLAKIITYFS